MSRAEAIEQYGNALRQGKKYYAACTARGVSPYPRVLDEEVNVSALSTVRIGLTDIPAENRMPTLMSDRMYRMAIAWQNVAYNQPPHPSFDMVKRFEEIRQNQKPAAR